MPIVRRTMSSGFTPISNLLADDDELPFDARGLLVYLLSKPPDWEVNIKNLVAAGGKNANGRNNTGRDRVYEILKILCNKGYVSREERRHKGRFVVFEYIVYGDAFPNLFPVTEIPEMDRPVPEKQEVVQPFPEKPDVGLPDVENSDAYKEITLPNNNNQKTISSIMSGFEVLWREFPHQFLPKKKSVAQHLFDELPADIDRANAIAHIGTYCRRCEAQGNQPKLILYLRDRLFRELVDAPPFDASGLFIITPDREEWRPWLDHISATVGEVASQSATDAGRILRKPRWPAERITT